MGLISLERMAEDLGMNIVNAGDVEEINVTTSNVGRPGLQLAGFFDYFARDRIQVIGRVEMTYLEGMKDADITERLDKLMQLDIPCLIISRNMPVPDLVLEASKRNHCPLLSSSLVTSTLIHRLITYLDDALAPRVTQHGVLVDVYGAGLFIVGESGIGKSETALELVKRGHRLVADDAVEIRKVDETRLVGEAPELIRHFMEIRGIGIIDIKAMYGVGSVINSKNIQMLIQLEFWDNTKEYDRLGLTDDFGEILGIKLPKIVLPVRPGRNLAIILEVAARNLRLKEMGYHAAKELDNRLNSLIQKNSKK